jgi:hypothetical protein
VAPPQSCWIPLLQPLRPSQPPPSLCFPLSHTLNHAASTALDLTFTASVAIITATTHTHSASPYHTTLITPPQRHLTHFHSRRRDNHNYHPHFASPHHTTLITPPQRHLTHFHSRRRDNHSHYVHSAFPINHSTPPTRDSTSTASLSNSAGQPCLNQFPPARSRFQHPSPCHVSLTPRQSSVDRFYDH